MGENPISGNKMYLWWTLCTLYFTGMPGANDRRGLRSLLLCLRDVFRAPLNSLISRYCAGGLGLVLVQVVIKMAELDPRQLLALYLEIKRSGTG